MAVEIFFMISGFYMSMILGGKYATTGEGIRLFYQNRALRLYPTYLLVMMGSWAVFLLTWIVIQKTPGNSWLESYGQMRWWELLLLILPNWTLLGIDAHSHLYFSEASGLIFRLPPDPPLPMDGSLYWVHGFRTVPQAWSLGLEIWFYLMAPFLAKLNWRWLVLMCVASLFVKLGVEQGLERYSYFFFPAQLHHFIFGMLAQRIGVAGWGKQLSPRVGLILTGMGYVLICLYPFGPHMLPKYVVLGFFAVSLPIIFRCTEKHPLDRLVGNLSYSFYLLHLDVWMVLQKTKLADPHLAALVCTILAVGVYVLLEKPLDAYRQARLRKRLSATEASAATGTDNVPSREG